MLLLLLTWQLRAVFVEIPLAIAEAFLGTPFEGGRHERRVQKIRDAEDENRR